MNTKSIGNFEKGACIMLFSALSVALLGTFVKLSYSLVNLPLLVFLRFFVPFLLVQIALIPMGTYKALIHVKWKNHIYRAIAVITSQYALFYYLSLSNLVNSIMLWNTAPIFIPIIAFFLFRQKISAKTWWGVCIGLIGVACILRPDRGLFNFSSIIGLIGGIAVALSQVLYGVNREKEGVDVNVLLFFLLGSCFTLGPLLFGYALGFELFSPLSEGFKVYGIILLIALMTIGNQAFRGIAYHLTTPARLAPINYMAVVFSGFIEWIWFNRPPTLLFYIGAILIVLGSTIERYGKHKKGGHPP